MPILLLGFNQLLNWRGTKSSNNPTIHCIYSATHVLSDCSWDCIHVYNQTKHKHHCRLYTYPQTGKEGWRPLIRPSAWEHRIISHVPGLSLKERRVTNSLHSLAGTPMKESDRSSRMSPQIFTTLGWCLTGNYQENLAFLKTFKFWKSKTFPIIP